MDPFAIDSENTLDEPVVKSTLLAPALSLFVWGCGQAFNGEYKKGAIFFSGQMVAVLYFWDFAQQHIFYQVMTDHLGVVLYSFCLFLFAIGVIFVWIYNLYDAHRIAHFLEFIGDRSPQEQGPGIRGWDFEADHQLEKKRFPWGLSFAYLLFFFAVGHYVWNLNDQGTPLSKLLQQAHQHPASVEYRLQLVDYYDAQSKYKHAELELEDFLVSFGSGLSVNERRLFEAKLSEVRERMKGEQGFVVDQVIHEQEDIDWVALSQEMDWPEVEQKAIFAFQSNPQDLQVARFLATEYLERGQWGKTRSLITQALRRHPQDPVLIQGLATAEDSMRRKRLQSERLGLQKQLLVDSVKAFKAGDWALARDKVEAYKRAGGQSKESYLLHNAVLLKAKDYKGALAALTEAVQNYPKDLMLNYSLGKVQFHLKNYSEAISYFQLAHKMKPMDAEILKNLGVACKRSGDYKSAVSWYNRALDLKRDDPRLIFLKAYSQLKAGDEKGSLESYRKLTQLQPDYPELAFYRAQAEESNGLLIGARKSYRQVDLESPYFNRSQDKIESLSQKIQEIQNQKKRQEVQRNSVPVREQARQAPKAPARELTAEEIRIEKIARSLQRGEEAYYAESWAEAKSAYHEILKLKPNHFYALKQLGRIALEQDKNYAQAGLYLERALSQKPADSWVGNALGVVAKSEGRVEDSIEYFESVLSSEPENLNANFNLALIYENQNEIDKAKSYYLNVITAHPNHLLAYNYLGDIYYNEGEFHHAVELYEGLLFKAPQNFSIRYKLALSLEQTGLNEKALDQVELLLRNTSQEDLIRTELLSAKDRIQAKL